MHMDPSQGTLKAWGPTRMAHIILLRNQNRKLNVELGKSNAPLGEVEGIK